MRNLAPHVYYFLKAGLVRRVHIVILLSHGLTKLVIVPVCVSHGAVSLLMDKLTFIVRQLFFIVPIDGVNLFAIPEVEVGFPLLKILLSRILDICTHRNNDRIHRGVVSILSV